MTVIWPVAALVSDSSRLTGIHALPFQCSVLIFSSMETGSSPACCVRAIDSGFNGLAGEPCALASKLGQALWAVCTR